jgi:hypothetical protein
VKSSTKQTNRSSDVRLEYFLGESDHDSHWIIYDADDKVIAEFNQPDLKKVFLAGYDYALRNKSVATDTK